MPSSNLGLLGHLHHRCQVFTWQKKKEAKMHLVSCIVLNMMTCKQNENHLRGADRLPAITPRMWKVNLRERMMQLEVLNQRHVRSSVGY